MATLAEVKAALAEYESKADDRQLKQDKHQADLAALQAAIDTETVSRDEWIAALKAENDAEDAFETLAVDHEPPALP